MCLQIRLYLFTIRPIAKQLNSLTTIVTFSWLGGAEITYPLWVRYVQGSIIGSGKGFMFDVLLFLYFYFLSKNAVFVITICNFFCNVNSLSELKHFARFVRCLLWYKGIDLASFKKWNRYYVALKYKCRVTFVWTILYYTSSKKWFYIAFTL